MHLILSNIFILGLVVGLSFIVKKLLDNPDPYQFEDIPPKEREEGKEHPSSEYSPSESLPYTSIVEKIKDAGSDLINFMGSQDSSWASSNNESSSSSSYSSESSPVYDYSDTLPSPSHHSYDSVHSSHSYSWDSGSSYSSYDSGFSSSSSWD